MRQHRRWTLGKVARAALLGAAAGAAPLLTHCGRAEDAPQHLVAGGDARRGARAIERYGCGTCHVIPGVRDAQGMVGPPLTAFARRTYVAGELPNTPDQLITWIEMPQSIRPGNAMPNLGVTDGDARDIAAYLYTLR